MHRSVLLSLALFGCASTADSGWDVPDGYELIYSQDFATQGSLADFHFTDPDAWDWHMDAAEQSYGTWLESELGSDYAPPHRSPLTIALVQGFEVGDFVLEVDVMNTAPASRGSHRDLCFFFGFEDAANFYYVHLAPVHLGRGPDEHAHNVFLVDDAARRRLAEAAERGIDWSDEWHKVRIERTLADGAIRVYFDDMITPVIEANDATHGWGRIGFGTFDDAGRYTNLRVFAPDARAVEHANPFTDS